MSSETKISQAKKMGLSELDLSDTQLKIVPKEIMDIKKLKVLNLRGNSIEELPKDIFYLPDLIKLDLSNNNLKRISPDIKDLANLRILYLGGNELTELPDEISELKNLEELYLTYNNFKVFPQRLVELFNLKYLYIGGNQIALIPKEINKLKHLSILNISYNQLEEIPNEILELNNLEELYLGANKISTIPVDIIKLKKLTVLNLSYNNITHIPLEITALEDLSVLMLSQNKISSIPKQLAQLTKLTQIGISGNLLTCIPKEIVFMNNLTKLSLFDNPLKNLPMDVAYQEITDIRYYFTSIKTSIPKTLYEAKLIIVGEGDVGKTSLYKKLINNDYKINDEKHTEGLTIEKWNWNSTIKEKESNVTVNIWDFGGQEIYYSTHQFFLTERSLYLFVWEARKEENYASFDYWLNIISSLGKNSPVMVVQNKIDIMQKEIDQAYYKEKFPNIIGFHKVSCLSGKGIKELTEDIKNVIANLPQIGIIWPEEWTTVRNILNYIKKDYIEYTEYLNICNENGLDEETASYLGRYLHVLGVIIHYQDDYILKNTVILNPEWGSKAVYKLLKSEKVEINNGKISYEDLEMIWEGWGYPSSKHMVLLHLMLRFELCFKLDGLDEFIIPELLPLTRPYYEWDFKNNLMFEYHYDFMPSGIITRFIVRAYPYVENNLFWRNGLLLKNVDGSKALVFCDTFGKKIKIHISGYNKRDFLVIIRNIFDHIHKSLNEKKVKEMVPCICEECRELNPYFHEYGFLRACLKNGINDVICHLHYKSVSVNKLLYGVEDTMGHYSIARQSNYNEDAIKTTALEVFDKSIFTYEKVIDKLLEYIEKNIHLKEEKQELLESIIIINKQDKDDGKRLRAKDKILKFIQEHADNIGTSVVIEVLKQLISSG